MTNIIITTTFMIFIFLLSSSSSSSTAFLIISYVNNNNNNKKNIPITPYNPPRLISSSSSSSSSHYYSYFSSQQQQQSYHRIHSCKNNRILIPPCGFMMMMFGGKSTIISIKSSLKMKMMPDNDDDHIDNDNDQDDYNIDDIDNDLTISTLIEFDTIDELLKEYDPILLFASRLLPLEKSKDSKAIYAWCRRLDEIVDNNTTTSDVVKLKQLDIWKHRLDKLWDDGQPQDKIDAELTDCIQRYSTNNNNNDDDNNDVVQLTKKPFEDMIEGMRSDIASNDNNENDYDDDDDDDGDSNNIDFINRRIKNMDELELYAYRVAGTVGVMLLPLLDAPNNQAKESAICLGKAIQLINILRDANPDIQKLGRIYLPQDLLRSHNVKESDILDGNATPQYREVVKFVVNRSEQLLMEAEIGSKKYLPSPVLILFVQIIIELYRGYLIELKKNRNYDNLTIYNGQERVKISTIQKLIATFRAIQKNIF